MMQLWNRHYGSRRAMIPESLCKCLIEHRPILRADDIRCHFQDVAFVRTSGVKYGEKVLENQPGLGVKRG